ncbi:MAG TPA: dTDP-4-dehydrorhamnose reductase [Polyangiaceae bacterium]|jgi:dTDP-4-dehydrorhamnose reductase|nr:dTDP-4-dehydrorhamnose reductase [Polyangiaceae bacterium]
MKVWLVGGKGMLGAALRARLEHLGVPCRGTDLELDIANEEAVQAFARSERPTHVVNAAAYTKVDDAETHEEDARRANALGPEHLARACVELGAPLLHFSTDYVFPGNADAPYVETDPTGPSGAYGRTKLEGERRIFGVPGAERLATVVRTSWLFGANGPSFPKTIAKMCLEKTELKVVADQKGRPTCTLDLAEAALDLLGLGARPPSPAGLYHFSNSGETTWHALAETIRDILLELGKPVTVTRVVPVTTAEFPRPAPRPAYSVLDTRRIEAALGRKPRPFQEPLREFLAAI